MANPQSRNEAILQSIVDETTYTEIPKSREEKLLLEIKDLIEQGGGGTSDVQGLILTMNTTTYVITAYLIDGEGHQVGESQSIDIPLEATIVDASYNNTTKIITFTLTSGAYLQVPIGDIVYGLQPLIDAQHKLPANLVDDTQGRFKFLWVGTAAQWEIDGPNCPVGTPRLITDDVDIDLVPTQGSNNPVTSDGVYNALARLDTTTGDIYFGQTRVGRKMSQADYDALATKDSIYYFTYQASQNSGRSLETPPATKNEISDGEDIRIEPLEEKELKKGGED